MLIRYADKYLEVFPSPCGDELFRFKLDILRADAPFPSPCGDELFQIRTEGKTMKIKRFPSPCGDELFLFYCVIAMVRHLVSVPLRG